MVDEGNVRGPGSSQPERLVPVSWIYSGEERAALKQGSRCPVCQALRQPRGRCRASALAEPMCCHPARASGPLRGGSWQRRGAVRLRAGSLPELVQRPGVSPACAPLGPAVGVPGRVLEKAPAPERKAELPRASGYAHPCWPGGLSRKPSSRSRPFCARTSRPSLGSCRPSPAAPWVWGEGHARPRQRREA